MSRICLTVLSLLIFSIAALPGEVYGQENEAPVITGHVDLSVMEDHALDLSLNDLYVSDPDNNYPEGFSLELDGGDNHTVSGNTITPNLNFNGGLVVRTRVNDGNNPSEYYDVAITVTAVNDPPAISGQNTLEVSEGGSINLSVSDFQITDVDSGPESFALIVHGGSGYSVSGTTVTPDAGFSGNLVVGVSVSDGTEESQIFDAQITVTAVNNAPVLQSHNALSFNEDQSFSITPADLVITDPDDTEFTVIIQSGTNYSVDGTTITPAANYSGTLEIPVSVSDGEASSNSLNVSVSIQPVNDPPVINSQNAVSTAEETAVTLTPANLNISDPDHDQSSLVLTVNTGSNYTVSGTTVTPSENFNGTLTVPVTISDGLATTDIFNMSVTVTAVNDAPVISGQNPLSTQEDTPITLSVSSLSVTDVDTNAGNLSLQVSAGENYTFSGTTITPASGYNGTLEVPVTVTDGTAQSNVFTVQIQVAAVNNAPVITGQADATTKEDTPFNLLPEFLSVDDADGDFPTGFTIKPAAGTNYTVSGTTITPAANFSGTLTIPVVVNDGLLNSSPFDFTLAVTAVNDAPAITGQKEVKTTEDQAVTLTLNHLTVTDVDNTYPNGFSLSVSSGTNYTVEGNAVIPAAEFSGALTVPVTVSDGAASSPSFNVTVNVTAVNDAPVITGQAGLSIAEEESIVLELKHFTVTDPDNPDYPTGFSLQVQGGDNYTVSGTTVTPASNFAGTLTVGVTVSDGQKSSAVFNATVNVGSLNDSPVITGQSTLGVDEDQTLTLQLANLTVTDADNSFPQGFSLTVHAGDNYTFSGASVTPAKNFNGDLTVPVTVSDGTTSSNIFELKITVRPVNDAPVVKGQVTVSTFKNTAVALSADKLVIEDPDNTDGFTLVLQAGQNYTLSQNSVSPAKDFLGTLEVPVSVSDGALTSNVFTLKISVVPAPNVPPVIEGQVTLSTFENEAINIELGHLVVTDPDNRYPDDFSFSLFPGSNYTVSGNSIVPGKDFSGTLNVPVTVSDKESTSEKFTMKIQVVPVTDAPLITSQGFLRMNEDDSLVLVFGDLIVLDADNTYPTGFTLHASAGSNYILDGLEVKPLNDFYGYLSVPVTVNDGVNASAPYQLLILVEPVNDAPTITDTESGDLVFDGSEIQLFKNFTIDDVDDDSLTFAQVSVAPGLQKGVDSLAFTNTSSIRGILDTETNTLVVFGTASVSEYETFVRSIRYIFKGTPSPSIQKTFSLSVNDGKSVSVIAQKVVRFEEQLTALDIPSGFTPNGDGANDTWVISPPEGKVDFNEAVIRVYNKRGSLVYEGKGLNAEWDGRMNGNVLPADTYFYTIDLKGAAQTNRYKGVITILR